MKTRELLGGMEEKSVSLTRVQINDFLNKKETKKNESVARPAVNSGSRGAIGPGSLR